MNIHPMQVALYALDDAIIATIDGSHRAELTMMAYKLRLILRAHGVFMPGGTEPTIQQRATCLRRDIASISALRTNTLPICSPVRVDCPRYHGFGFIRSDDDCGIPDRLLVQLANGNQWFYPIESCHPAKWADVDRSTRLYYLRWRGRQCKGITHRTPKLP